MATKEDYRTAGAHRFKAGEVRPVGKPHWSLTVAQEGWDEARDAHILGMQAQARKSAPASVSVASGPIPSTEQISVDLTVKENERRVLAPFRQYCHGIRGRLQHLGWQFWPAGARGHVLALVAILETTPDRDRGLRVHLKVLAMMERHGIHADKEAQPC